MYCHTLVDTDTCSQGKKANHTEATPALADDDEDEQEPALYRRLEKDFNCDTHPGKACWVKIDGVHYQFTTQDLATWTALLVLNILLHTVIF